MVVVGGMKWAGSVACTAGAVCDSAAAGVGWLFMLLRSLRCLVRLRSCSRPELPELACWELGAGG